MWNGKENSTQIHLIKLCVNKKAAKAKRRTHINLYHGLSVFVEFYVRHKEKNWLPFAPFWLNPPAINCINHNHKPPHSIANQISSTRTSFYSAKRYTVMSVSCGRVLSILCNLHGQQIRNYPRARKTQENVFFHH